MRSTFRVSTALVALMGLAASAGAAQSANITVTANVLQAMTVAGTRPLDFGNVFPGVARPVGVGAATSGLFTLTGQNSANVNVSFTLPTTLVSGANSLPIGTWTGYHNTTNNATVGGTAFTPSVATTATAFSATGNLFVFIGGTVTPIVSQAAGTYTGIVTLTAAYF